LCLQKRTFPENFVMGACCRDCSPKNSTKCRNVVFYATLFLELVDLITDWLVYFDVKLMEKGLVFGPPGDAVIYGLLVFSVIGTLTFFFEIFNLWLKMFRLNAWVNTDLVSAVIIWIEDLPQISINLYIAHCREDPSSGFQLFKAAVVLFGKTYSGHLCRCCCLILRES